MGIDISRTARKKPWESKFSGTCQATEGRKAWKEVVKLVGRSMTFFTGNVKPGSRVRMSTFNGDQVCQPNVWQM